MTLRMLSGSAVKFVNQLDSYWMHRLWGRSRSLKFSRSTGYMALALAGEIEGGQPPLERTHCNLENVGEKVQC